MGNTMTMDIGQIFKDHIKIEPQVMAIETLFNNKRRFENTNYKPPYQRNYVWSDEKATYFIESILLGTEIPPLIFFNSGEVREVIDGRQRYETIYRFVNNQFKLKKAGLLIFKDLSNKSFNDLKALKDIIWDTKLRIIEFSFHSKPQTDYDIEDIVKKEIFKRYNTGITPLKSTEIDKAFYITDDLNGHIKKTLAEDKRLHHFIVELFSFDDDNIELILKKIRQLLVQHKIPISYYAAEKQEVINKFYELLTEGLENDEAKIGQAFNDFIYKINYLFEIKQQLLLKDVPPNACRLVLECVFWAISVLENENIASDKYDNKIFKDKLLKYIVQNITKYKTERSSFNSQIFERYSTTASFIEKEFGLVLKNYITNNDDFKKYNRSVSKSKTDTNALSKFESLRLNKPDAVSCSIEDISRQMTKQRFMVRPIYQRNEVINKKKSSAIIESIMLGIKLPPIFIFKREDGVSEVIDGQQRLLSIIGFTGKSYLDENKRMVKSEKNDFSLNLKNGILKHLDKSRYQTLDKNIQDKISDYNLWIIEISQKDNIHFDPVDLYIRLNNKPYPIKENTFEMWNSYISRDIIETIKTIHKRHKDWFYLRKNNSRMEDENLYASLVFLQFNLNKEKKSTERINELDIYKIGDKINFRVKAKTEITKLLEDSNLQEDIVKACNDFEFIFIKKLRTLLADDELKSVTVLNKNLDYIFSVQKGKRTQQSFYALWYFLYNIPLSAILISKQEIRDGLRELFLQMTFVESKGSFDEKVEQFIERHKLWQNDKSLEYFSFEDLSVAGLGEITSIAQGILSQNVKKTATISSGDKFSYLRKGTFGRYIITDVETEKVFFEDSVNIRETFETKPQIFIKRMSDFQNRLTTALYESQVVPNADILSCTVIRSGFSPKYLFAILSSRLFYFLYQRIAKISPEDIKPVSPSLLRNIPIPVLTRNQQEPFIRVAEYLVFLSQNKLDLTFFERLNDAMVYELFMPDVMRSTGTNVLTHLNPMPELIQDNDERNKHIVDQQYKELADPRSPINAALLKLLSVDLVASIEGSR